MIQEDSLVSGIDINNNQIQGTVTNVLKCFGIAIIKTGDDRTCITEAYLDNIKETSFK